MTTRTELDLAAVLDSASSHGDTAGAHTLAVLDRHVLDGITVLADETHGWVVECHADAPIVLTPAQAVKVVSRIEAGTVEVSADGAPVVSSGRPGEWIELDASEVDGE